MAWPTSNHESPDVALALPQVVAPHYLWSILKADGEDFRANDYGIVRNNIDEAVSLFGAGAAGGQRPSSGVSDQRLRTWKKAFEDLGLLTVEDDKVRTTRFGKAVIEGWERVDESLHGANARIALLGAEVANRVLLQPPGKALPGVAAGADLHPIRAIWRAFVELGGKLHWQDINRVLGHLDFEADLEAAIQQIREYRQNGGTYTDADLAELGPKPLSNDARHITPWLNRASLGGILFPSEADRKGFRRLTSEGERTIRELLEQAPPPLPADANAQAYLRYLMEPVQQAETPIPEADREIIQRIVDAAKEFGSSKFIALAGIPGTGKTRLARLVADRLVDGDESRLREIQFHESVSYDDFVEGFVPRKDGSGFDLRPKVLKSINQRALDNPDQEHILIVEEFTRGNTHAVLGELLTYIEHRNRTFQWSLSQEPTSIAPNLIVLVTMNPRDRSALQLDTAVRRRMHTIDIPTSREGLIAVTPGMPEETLNPLLDWFDKFGPALPFGHGLFADAKDEATLRQVWQATVLPLLMSVSGEIAEPYKAAAAEFPFS